MIQRERKPTHPGVILKELYLKERGIKIKDFAAAVGVTPKHMSNLVNAKARIDATMAYRIATVLQTDAQTWLNGQNAYDLWEAERTSDWQPATIFAV